MNFLPSLSHIILKFNTVYCTLGWVDF
jgi:hypothetical protein